MCTVLSQQLEVYMIIAKSIVLLRQKMQMTKYLNVLLIYTTILVICWLNGWHWGPRTEQLSDGYPRMMFALFCVELAVPFLYLVREERPLIEKQILDCSRKLVPEEQLSVTRATQFVSPSKTNRRYSYRILNLDAHISSSAICHFRGENQDYVLLHQTTIEFPPALLGMMIAHEVEHVNDPYFPKQRICSVPAIIASISSASVLPLITLTIYCLLSTLLKQWMYAACEFNADAAGVHGDHANGTEIFASLFCFSEEAVKATQRKGEQQIRQQLTRTFFRELLWCAPAAYFAPAIACHGICSALYREVGFHPNARARMENIYRVRAELPPTPSIVEFIIFTL